MRSRIDRLDADIQVLVAKRDEVAARLIHVKGRAPYDPRREDEIASQDEAFWLPMLRRVRTAEGARLPPVATKPGAFPAGGFVLIAGPCAVDEHLDETLTGMAKAGLKWARAGAWKPRTFPWSFQGEGLLGLRRMRDCADRLGLKIVSEVVSERDAPAASELLDVVQVGARNAQNFALLKLLCTLGKPVLLKRGPACTIEEWLGAAAYLDGRVAVTLCERGVRGFDPCFRNLLDLPGAVLARRLGGFQTIIDPSHGTGIAGLITPMVLAGRAAGLDGAIVEVHAHPSKSRSDADQALHLHELVALVRALGIKAAALALKPVARSAAKGAATGGRASEQRKSRSIKARAARQNAKQGRGSKARVAGK